MPKRIGNTQISSLAGHSDILDIRSHKKLVVQDVYPDTANDVVRGVRFDGSSYLSRNMSGTGQAKWTFSFWVKRSALGTNHLVGENYPGVGHDAFISFSSSDQLYMLDKYCSGGCATNYKTTDALYRDLHSFYHVVCTFNGSESSVSDGFKIYVNGQLPPSTAGADSWPRNSAGWFLGTMYIGRSYAANYLRGYMAEMHFIEGQELTPTDFAYYDNGTKQWKPKEYAGIYGTNGFYLPMRTGQYTQDETGTTLNLINNTIVKGFKPQTNFNFGSFYFDGADDYVEFNDGATLLGSGEFTIELWFHATSLPSNSAVMLVHSSFELAIASDKEVSFAPHGEPGTFTHLESGNSVTTGQWYHVAVSRDSNNNIRMYIDGVYKATVNSSYQFTTSDTAAKIGAHKTNGNKDFNGYITDLRIVVNQAIYTGTASFTPPSEPLSKTYDHVNQQTITGCTLLVQPDAAGVDESGNNNDWTVTGMSKHDGGPDSPHNTFATLNPLQKDPDLTLADGSLSVTTGGVGAIGSTFYVSSGVYYWEIYYKTTAYDVQYGLISDHSGTTTYIGNLGYKSYGVINFNGNSIYNTTQVSNVISAGSAGDVYRILLDMDQGEWSAAINSGSFSTIHTGITAPVSPAIGSNGSTGVNIFNFGQDPTFSGNKTDSLGPYTDANGIGEFYYQPPTGALALCTQNLPAPVIEDPAEHFKCVKWGNQSQGDDMITYIDSPQPLGTVNVGFAPDFVWVKARNADSHHAKWDTLRGNKSIIYSSLNNGRSTGSYSAGSSGPGQGYNGFENFTDTGFTLNEHAGGGEINHPSRTYIAWCWRAGGAPTVLNDSGATESSNNGSYTYKVAGQTPTAGSVKIDGENMSGAFTSADRYPSKMSVNNKAGFSMFTYYPPKAGGPITIPHGLSKAPEFVAVKTVQNGGFHGSGGSAQSGDWMIYHVSTGNTKKLNLNNSTTQSSASSTYWNNTSPTDSLITLGSDLNIASSWSNSATEYVCYCWHSVPGFSAFGSYKSISLNDGTEDGPFVYTGFKPAWLMIKAASLNSTNWMIWDNARDTYNRTDNILRANTSGQEVDGTWKIDFVSNGFKIRTLSSDHINRADSIETYVYMAFAEQSTNFTTAR